MSTTDAKTQPEFRQQTTDLLQTQVEIGQARHQTENDLESKRNKGGRPRKTPNVIPWTVRGVDLETRTAIEKAASRSGKTIGQYINEDVRYYVQDQLKSGSQSPMRQEDIRNELDDIKGMIAQLVKHTSVKEEKGFLRKIFKL